LKLNTGLNDPVLVAVALVKVIVNVPAVGTTLLMTGPEFAAPAVCKVTLQLEAAVTSELLTTCAVALVFAAAVTPVKVTAPRCPLHVCGVAPLAVQKLPIDTIAGALLLIAVGCPCNVLIRVLSVPTI